jgi:uncharacterized protein (DUF2164 family)
MSIELSKQVRDNAIASIQQYFERNLTEPIGQLPASLLLNYFIEEIGPAIYNQAIVDAQARLQQWIADLEGELYEGPFQYWHKAKTKRNK